MTTKEAYEAIVNHIKDEELTEEVLIVAMALCVLRTKAEEYDAIMEIVKEDD